MSTRPNTVNNLNSTNNYFEISNNMYIYEIGVKNICYDDERIEFVYRNRYISIHIPSTKELEEYPSLIDVIEKGLMGEGVPYDDIIKITGYFESYEEEMIKNILHERRS